MPFRIEPFREEHLAATRDFNRRLSSARVAKGFLLPESIPRAVDRSLPFFKEQFVVLDERGLHGGFMLQHQDFLINGHLERIGNYQMPISEGLIDRKYAPVGLLMLREALGIHPRLYALGMGGRNNQLPRMLQAFGWRLWDVPFLFHVHNPTRFLRQIRPLRTTAPRRFLMDAAAATGFGAMGIRLMQMRPPRQSRISASFVEGFGSWADVLWGRSRSGLLFGLNRTSETLNLLYAQPDQKYLRVMMTRGDVPIGWVVLLETQMRQHRYFGDLRVGTLVDGVAVSGETVAVVAAALAILDERGVDLTVCNQAHEDWVSALRRNGFISGPSNYVFAASKDLAKMLGEGHHMHITRGDGDGPLTL